MLHGRIPNRTKAILPSLKVRLSKLPLTVAVEALIFRPEPSFFLYWNGSDDMTVGVVPHLDASDPLNVALVVLRHLPHEAIVVQPRFTDTCAVGFR